MAKESFPELTAGGGYLWQDIANDRDDAQFETLTYTLDYLANTEHQQNWDDFTPTSQLASRIIM